MHTYEYPRPSLTADCVIFGFDGSQLKVLLIRRKLEPFKDMWALPGGFMQEGETLEECALRELSEETHLVPEFLEQFHTFSSVGRDPRGRVVTVAYYALVPISEVVGGTDAADAQWFNIGELPPLAFDHKEILDTARECLRDRIHFEPIAFRLLGSKFTMTELQRVYELILDTKFDRRNFQKKAVTSNCICSLGEVRSGSTPSRPAGLYFFDDEEYKLFRESFRKKLEL